MKIFYFNTPKCCGWILDDNDYKLFKKIHQKDKDIENNLKLDKSPFFKYPHFNLNGEGQTLNHFINEN